MFNNLWDFKSKKPAGELSIKNLHFMFKDDDGLPYYRFPKGVKIPLERHFKRAEIATWMSAGLTRQELDRLLDLADAELENMVMGKKGSLVTVAAILKQLRLREHMVLHHELVYQWLAVHYVREGEEIHTINETIMDEKIAAFKKMVAGGRLLDFFQLPELKDICQSIDLSSAEFQKSWDDSIQEQKTLQQKMQYLISEYKLRKQGKTESAAS